MRALRSVLFWMHLTCGLLAGVVILIMSATGVLLTYERQMQRWADLRHLEQEVAPAGATRLAADSLLRVVVAREGKAPTNVTWRADSAAPVEMQFGREGRKYISAYTGAVLGTGDPAMRKLFGQITDWHRWLAMSGESRATGRKFTGVSNLAFFVLVLSGAWLWWPRNITWRSVRQVLWFRRGLAAKARDFNWHNVLGVWSLVPLVVVVGSGVVMSYSWASNLVYTAAGEAPPSRTPEPPAAQRAGPPGGREGATASPVVPTVGDVAALATSQIADWRAVSLAWPRSERAPLVFTIDAGSGGEPQKRGTLTVPRNGEAAKWQPFATQTKGRRWRSWLRFLHTGEALGLWGQTIAGLVSLAAVVLVYTGIALSLRRFAAWRVRRTRAAASANEAVQQRESLA